MTFIAALERKARCDSVRSAPFFIASGRDAKPTTLRVAVRVGANTAGRTRPATPDPLDQISS
ncbi:hypothetical protein [Burkholderia sp. Ac-20353]|uniref:hypothetical protein n=1 Tax=Burkholderia sp. Ac-20353 TaxID=2703894 RepID=UPI00197BE65A|nr:hypothetical protein [Burkholderia sp. Ac-20353]MBN3790011.1 hypothetical protein [Burkholderia sp. Ac-20353]